MAYTAHPGRRAAGILAAAAEAAASTHPILRRELLELLRSRRAFYIAILTVAAAGLFPLLYWPDEGRPMASFYSRNAFEAYQWTFLGAIFLFLPIVTAGTIAGERERDTYEALHCTLIRPISIILAKLIAPVLYFLLLIALSFPMACVLFLLGGLEFREFLVLLGNLAAFTAFLGLIGVSCSMRSRRTYHAALRTYGFGIILSFGAAAIFNLPAAGVVLLAALGAVIGLWMFLSLLGKAAYPDLRHPNPWEPGAGPAERLMVKLEPLKAGPPRRGRSILAAVVGEIPDGWNPVFFLSLTHSAIAAIQWCFVISFVGIIICYFIFPFIMAGGSGAAVLAAAAGILILCAIALVIPGAAAAILMGEREPEKLDLLRSTPLTAGRIIRGKLLAVLLVGSKLLVLGALGMALFLTFLFYDEGARTIPFLIAIFLAGGTSCLLAASTAGLLAAACSRVTIQALVLATLLSAGSLLVAPFLAREIAAETGRYLPAALFSPIHCLQAAAAALPERGIPLRHVSISTAITLALAAAQYYLAIGIFHRRWMRDA